MRKCGFHIQQVSPELRAAILQVYPTLCVSLAHDRDFWQEVQRDCPDTLLIGRLFEEGRDWRQTDPRWWAEQCAALGMPYQAFITWNEPEGIYNWVTADDAKCYDDWCCRFRERGLELGFEAVGPNVPAGHWHGDAVVRHLPDLCQTFRYIALHEYSARAMWDQQPKLCRPPELVPRNEGESVGWWYTLRYRQWWRAICERYPWRVGQFQIVVSEGGVAYGVMEAGYGDVGWRMDMSEEQYFASLDWYTRRLNEDGYCLGWAIFMVGGNPDWEKFETLPIWRRLMAIPEVAVQPPSEPEGTMVRVYDFEHGPGDPETRDWDWLKSVFGDIQVHPIENKVKLKKGDVVYKLDYLDARVGDANIIINVRDVDSKPVHQETTIFGWPSAEPHGYPEKASNWTEHGVAGDTNVNGDVGPGLGKGAYYDPKTIDPKTGKPQRGPHFVWVYDLPSDMVDGLGMLPGGEPEPGVQGPHAHVNLGYRAVVWGGETPTPPTPPPTPPPPGSDDAGQLVSMAASMIAIAGRMKAGQVVSGEVTLFLSDGSQVKLSIAPRVGVLNKVWARVRGLS